GGEHGQPPPSPRRRRHLHRCRPAAGRAPLHPPPRPHGPDRAVAPAGGRRRAYLCQQEPRRRAQAWPGPGRRAAHSRPVGHPCRRVPGDGGEARRGRHRPCREGAGGGDGPPPAPRRHHPPCRCRGCPGRRHLPRPPPRHAHRLRQGLRARM
ncbi:MAG: RuvC, partial [uncultured Craurococcus sp.]